MTAHPAPGSGLVLTVTPNPSIDRTVEIDVLTRGAVLRARAHHVDPGGKGVNVSRVLARFGLDTVALMPGGDGELATLLRRAGIRPESTPAHGPTRVNTALVEPGGMTTKVNEPGVELGAAEVDALVDVARARADGASWVVTAGSVPRGAPDDLHARIVAAARSAGARAAVDTSGPALRAALEAHPDLIKPNVAELAELVGRPLPRLADVLDAAADLRRGGVGSVLVSMGAAGAVLVDGEGTWHAGSPPRAVRSTVGAGDSALAGFLISRTRGASAPEALVHAVACGAAAVGLPGTAVPGPDDVDVSDIRPVVPDTTLDSLDLSGEAA